MILSDRERLQFIEYCRVQADSAKAMHEQMLKLPYPAMKTLAEQEKLKAACYAYVARDLMSFSTEEVSGSDVGDIAEIADQPEHNEDKQENHPDSRFD